MHLSHSNEKEIKVIIPSSNIFFNTDQNIELSMILESAADR